MKHGGSLQELVLNNHHIIEDLSPLAYSSKTYASFVIFSFANRRNGDVSVLYASAAKAKKEFGGNPKLTLDDMIKSSWDWEKKEKYFV